MSARHFHLESSFPSITPRPALRGRAVAALVTSVVATVFALGSAEPTIALAAPVSQAGCQGNLLVNPGFDGGQRKTESLGTSLSSSVADGWFPWFVRGDATWNREPEFKLNIPGVTGDAYRVRGGNSMKWFTTWATHDAGMYQRVAVPAGSTVTFSAWGMIYSGEEDGHRPDLGTFFSDQEKNGSYRLQVGIEPHGNLPAHMGAPPPDSVAWSAEDYTMDHYTQLSVSTAARAAAVTVYMRGKAIWPVKHNNAFFEDACLSRGGGGVAVDVAAPSLEATAEVIDDGAANEQVADGDAETAPEEAAAASSSASDGTLIIDVAAVGELRLPVQLLWAFAFTADSRKATGAWGQPR